MRIRVKRFMEKGHEHHSYVIETKTTILSSWKPFETKDDGSPNVYNWGGMVRAIDWLKWHNPNLKESQIEYM